MISALDWDLREAPGGSNTRIRCICHILNLVVGAILSQFKPKKTKDAEGDPIDEGEDAQEGDAEDDVEDEEGIRSPEEQDPLRAEQDEAELEQLEIDEVLDARAIVLPSISDKEWTSARAAFRKVRNYMSSRRFPH